MNERVLLVDDDVELLELLRDYLVREGFVVECVHDGLSGVAEARSGRHDLVVLDIMMPGIDGIQALTQIRQQTAIPVLMLSARGDDADRILGLEIGADDYVPKPCSPRELAARIRAILKRIPGSAPELQAVVSGDLVLWPAQRRAEDAGRPLGLTSTEFSILEMLARHAGQPVAKTVLSESALGRPFSRFDRSIDVHVSSIRHKLGPLPDGRQRIHTVIRRGYLLVVA